MTLTLRSAADAAARATKSKNEAQSARITILLFTRKGLRWTVYAGLLALRVRMAERPLALAVSNWLEHPDCADGLPGIAPSGPAAIFSLTVARQRGNCTRFPVFATGQRRANRRTFQRTENSGVRNLVEGLGGSQITSEIRVVRFRLRAKETVELRSTNGRGRLSHTTTNLGSLVRWLSDKDQAAVWVFNVELGHAILPVE